MAYTMKHGKLVNPKKLAKSFDRAMHFFDDVPQDELDRFKERTKGMPPREISKWMLRVQLAGEVREFMKANLPNEVMNKGSEDEAVAHIIEAASAQGERLDPEQVRKDYREMAKLTTHEFTDTITDENVVEILELCVNGDLVIDDARIHQWHRKKLDEYKDACINIDGPESDQVEAFGTAVLLFRALKEYDVLFEPQKGTKLDFNILANAAGRELFEGIVDEWHKILPTDDENLTNGFLFASIYGSAAKPHGDYIRYVATEVANTTTLRVGIIKPYGDVEPITKDKATA